MPGPYTLNIRDLARRPGESKAFTLDVRIPEAFGNAVIGVREGDELRIEGRLESLHDGILVTATVDGEADGECVRCLIPVTEPVEVDFQELFAYPGTSDFDYFVQDDSLDLEQVVRDTVVPALPFQPVCQEDCEGLCPVCGVRLLDDPGHEHAPRVDPRWAALEGLASGEQLPDSGSNN
ncbi:MAG: DUF177 domain-containing protein [Microbacteriaceae bacterium]|nr:DUF177 domain-containing protein [Microbacteriaceae bacterium]